ncbi:MAG TPA: pitrilysin family protein [Candidatus Acidoferrales bacterium]|nr:pitrilysin family protein [Candidatus Acidoferrales bacterium]
MKKRVSAVMLATLLLCCVPSFAQAPAAQSNTNSNIPATWNQVPIPPLPAFKPKQPKRIQFANGMVVFLQEDHELPLINGYARIRGGSRSEPANKVGMVTMYGDVWRQGGTAKMTGDAMDDYLEARAAKVETSGSTDSTTIGFDCLKGDFDDVFALFVDLLRNPEFREDKLPLAKDQMRTEISRRNDDTEEIAGRETRFLAYGRNNPYARIPEYATVAAVTREDLVNWHKQHVAPNNIILGIQGDFDPAKMEAALHKAFDGWAKGPTVEPPKIEFQPAKPGVYVVDKEDVNQSVVRMVSLGIRRDNPDYFAAQVMNEVFGGGFSSRLFSNLRTKRGLAYEVGGGLTAAFDHPGLFYLTIATKSQTTVEALNGLKEELDDLQKRAPTDEEMKRAKDSILNSFIFNFDTPGKVLRERISYEFYGYPADFLERYRAGVEKVTPADVLRVAQKYIHKEQLSTLIVGNLSEFEKSAKELGPFTKLDIEIPSATESNAEAAPKPTASNSEGKALFAKFVQWLGGEQKVGSIKSFRQVLDVTQLTPQGPMQLSVDQTVSLPLSAYTKIDTPMGEMIRAVNPETAWMSMAGKVQALPASSHAEALSGLKRDLIIMAQHANDPEYVFSGDGAEKIGAENAAVLNISGGGLNLRWLLDPQTGRLIQSSYLSNGSEGPVKRVVTFNDWKEFAGLNLPSKTVITEDGADAGNSVLKEMTVNVPVDSKLFQKPSGQ